MSQHSRFYRATPGSIDGAKSADTAVFVLPASSADLVAIRAGVQQVDAELLAEMRAVTGLDAGEICRRDPENLVNPKVVQPIVYLLGFVYGRALQQCGVRPRALGGHSFGQYTALALAGAIDFSAGLRLVSQRAEAISGVAPPPGSQLVKVQGLAVERVERLRAESEGDAWLSAISADDEVTLRGDAAALDLLARKLRAAGATRVILLMGSGVLHTPLMHDAARTMEEALAHVRIAEPRHPVASSVSGGIERDPERWRELLALEPVSTVRWRECFASLPGEIPVLELGAAGGLAELVSEHDPSRLAITVDSLETVGRAAEVCAPVLV